MPKTYAEYLAEDRKRPPSKHLAPPNALPKRSKGDTMKHRWERKNDLRRGLIDIHDIPVTKNGLIDTRKVKAIRRKIYKVQEESHGR